MFEWTSSFSILHQYEVCLVFYGLNILYFLRKVCFQLPFFYPPQHEQQTFQHQWSCNALINENVKIKTIKLMNI